MVEKCCVNITHTPIYYSMWQNKDGQMYVYMNANYAVAIETTLPSEACTDEVCI